MEIPMGKVRHHSMSIIDLRQIFQSSRKLIKIADIWYLMSGIILCMRPANESSHYIATSSPIGWAHTQNDTWIYFKVGAILRHFTTLISKKMQCQGYQESSLTSERERERERERLSLTAFLRTEDILPVDTYISVSSLITWINFNPSMDK